MPLHPLLAAVLKSWIEHHWMTFVGRGPEPSDPVLPRWDGGFHRPSSAAQMRYDLALAGCPTTVKDKNVTFYALRRSFLTWLKEAGVSAEDRRALAGHAGRDVEERHYIAKRLPALHDAVAKITLDVEADDVLRTDETTRRPRRERRGVRTGSGRRRSDERPVAVGMPAQSTEPPP